VAALRKAGATVQHLHEVGFGCPDILVGFRGVSYVLEIKAKRGKLNEREKIWHQWWRGQVAVVRTIDEALKVIGAIG
jgi:hypothetical protein